MDASQPDGNIADYRLAGQRIRKAREKRRLSLAQLSGRTCVSIRYIQHMEEGRFDRLPGRPYVVGFTKALCSALGLSHQDVMALIDAGRYPCRRDGSVVLPAAPDAGDRAAPSAMARIWDGLSTVWSKPRSPVKSALQ